MFLFGPIDVICYLIRSSIGKSTQACPRQASVQPGWKYFVSSVFFHSFFYYRLLYVKKNIKNWHNRCARWCNFDNDDNVGNNLDKNLDNNLDNKLDNNLQVDEERPLALFPGTAWGTVTGPEFKYSRWSILWSHLSIFWVQTLKNQILILSYGFQVQKLFHLLMKKRWQMPNSVRLGPLQWI